MKHIYWAFLTFLMTNFQSLIPAKGKDLGVHGHTFEIQEPDLLKEIGSKLRNLKETGELKKHNAFLLKKAEQAIHTPPPVKGITKAARDRIWYYDPSLTVPYDLKDHQGRVFHKKSTRINPLHYRSLSSTLVFIDGRDEDQVDWLKRTYLGRENKTKIILIAGPPFDLMESFQEPVYFDQGGTLTKKLGIKHVPAVVVQEGLKLKITEVALEENLK